MWERYRSGHNGTDSKSVGAFAHEGSNPSLSARSVVSKNIKVNLIKYLCKKDSNPR